MTAYLVHCNRPSNSARALAKALRGKKVNYEAGRSHPASMCIINWGDSQCPSHLIDLNKPKAIATASNKLRAFDVMKKAGVQVPQFATSMTGVSWKGPTVVRHKLTGHSGEGIEIVESAADLPKNAPLYVEYIKKEHEFRIHVGRAEGQAKIIAIQRKARDKAVPDASVDWKVRSHANGFIFVRGDANPHPTVLTEAVNALAAIGLDFGAVDVIWNMKESKAYVLEINTAPGLEGQTIDDYASFFKSCA